MIRSRFRSVSLFLASLLLSTTLALLLLLLTTTQPGTVQQLRYSSGDGDSDSNASNDTHYNIQEQAGRPRPLIDPESSLTFSFKEIHRHGTGQYYEFHQRLQVSSKLKTDAGLLFQQLLTLPSRDDLWIDHADYSTDNPFDYNFRLRSRLVKMKRPHQWGLRDDGMTVLSTNPHIDQNGVTLVPPELIDWYDEDVVAPDVTDRDTVVALALMSSNAYTKVPGSGEWLNISEPWNGSDSNHFGWDGKGLRGHVFTDTHDKVVVIAYKGTSTQGMPGTGKDETSVNDKLNDNLLFSCCCARVSYLWNTVCDCYLKPNTCDEVCLEKELRRKDRYYQAAIDIYREVRNSYPHSEIWLTGHSMGGALASLVGRTFGVPAVTFQAPGELLASRRLHLPFPPGLSPSLEGVWHFGHTADPIFLGTCNGASSSCSITGYAMETSCHTGKVCVYNVTGDKGWHVNVLNHKIRTVIDNVLLAYDKPAVCQDPEPCIDCSNWEYQANKDIVATVPNPDKTFSTTTEMQSTATTGVQSESPTISTSPTCTGMSWLGFCFDWLADSYPVKY